MVREYDEHGFIASNEHRLCLFQQQVVCNTSVAFLLVLHVVLWLSANSDGEGLCKTLAIN